MKKTVLAQEMTGSLHLFCANCEKEIAQAVGWSGLNDNLTDWGNCKCGEKINREEVDRAFMAHKKSLYEDYLRNKDADSWEGDDGEDLEFNLRREI